MEYVNNLNVRRRAVLSNWGYANLLCIVPILVYVLPKQANSWYSISEIYIYIIIPSLLHI